MLTGKIGKSAARAIVVASVAGLVAAAAPAGAQDTCGPTRQRTLALKVRSDDNTLRLGDTAKFSVSVVRNAKQVLDDERIGGSRSESGSFNTTPAEGAEVIIGLSGGDVSLYGGSVTDAKGRAVVKFRVSPQMSLGRADLNAFARISYDTPCHLQTEEWGEFNRSGFARISD